MSADLPPDPSLGLAGDPPGRGRPLRLLADYLGLLAVLAGMVLLFALLSDRFLTVQTFATMANQIPDLTVVAVGMTFVLLVAGIDLSVGSVLALAGALIGVMIVDGGGGAALAWSLDRFGTLLPGQILLCLAAAGVCLAVGLACGLANGLISVKLSIPSFIVTLGMLEIARGAAYVAAGQQTKYVGEAFEPLTQGLPLVRVSPAFLLAGLVVIAAQFVLTMTVFGRYALAVGNNEEAARLSGIATHRVKIAAFAISGVLAAMAALFQTSKMAAADPGAGLGMELAAIAAVVIGGTSLMGGRGSVLRSFLGVLIITVLQTGLVQVGASNPTKRVVTGCVIIVAVVLDAVRQHATREKWKQLRARWRRAGPAD